jgi:hypothetical protein
VKSEGLHRHQALIKYFYCHLLQCTLERPHILRKLILWILCSCGKKRKKIEKKKGQALDTLSQLFFPFNEIPVP